jgi:hypothetical protein
MESKITSGVQARARGTQKREKEREREERILLHSSRGSQRVVQLRPYVRVGHIPVLVELVLEARVGRN